ncbi:MAG: hypothetical protein U5J83_14220 [Bryobacterales bacterium]|nr:hypothetical protein [Bryobacterales bacterium]
MAAVVTIAHLQGLLRERGFAHSLPWQSSRGPAAPTAPSGVMALDALLEGGFARGQISEISGALSSGCTGAAMAMVAAATRRGEATAYIDATDNFHPPTAQQAGVDLERLLLVRCQWPREAWDAVNLVVGAGGFGLIVLDLMGTRSRRFLQEWQMRPWLKLHRSIENSPTTLLVAATHKGIAAHAAVARVEFRRKEAQWQGLAGVSFVLGGMEVEAALAYQRHPRQGKRSPQREQSCTFALQVGGEREATG